MKSHRRIFSRPGGPTRRAVVDRLTEGPASVKELAAPFKMAPAIIHAAFGDFGKQPAHQNQKGGAAAYLHDQHAALDQMMDWMSDRRALMKKRLDALEDYLDNEQLN